MSKWYSCERCLKKPGPMLARDQALRGGLDLTDARIEFRRATSTPLRVIGIVHQFESRNRCWVSCTLPADPFLTRRRGKDSTEIHVKSLLSMRKPLLGDVSKPGQLSLALLDAILIFTLRLDFDLRLVKNMIRALP